MRELLDAIWDNLRVPIGNFLIIDLIAATTNAFISALLVRHAGHYRRYTVVGIILLAVGGGIGGSVARDVLLNRVPAPLVIPWYLILCVLAAGIARAVDSRTGERLRGGLLKFMAAFALPWYAAIGAEAALVAGLPVMAALTIGIIGGTAGRYFVDITSGVTPQQFIQGEWFVGTAALTSVVYIVLYFAGLSIWPATLLAVAIGFTFRLAALSFGWEEPVQQQLDDGN